MPDSAAVPGSTPPSPRLTVVGNALHDLPADLRLALTRLRVGLLKALGDDLVCLVAYGSATRPDRPRHRGDVDTHGVLRVAPDPEAATRIEQVHDAIAAEFGIEWDSWYILERDARRPEPPSHALRRDLVDRSWSLHRAHWLAGEYILLHGSPAAELVPPPTWPELEAGLRGEAASILRELAAGRDDAPFAAYAVANACRILYSITSRDVVVSKRAALSWGRAHLPETWAPAIESAERVSDGDELAGDAQAVRAHLGEIIAAAELACARPAG